MRWRSAAYRCVLAGGFFAAALSTAVCDVVHDLIPRTVLSVPSPDGRLVAFVHQRPSIDPPDHSLWLRMNRRDVHVATLGADSEACAQILWAPASDRVIFVGESGIDPPFAIVASIGQSGIALRRVPLPLEPHGLSYANVRLSDDGQFLVVSDLRGVTRQVAVTAGL